jgi:hypothetical protein
MDDDGRVTDRSTGSPRRRRRTPSTAPRRPHSRAREHVHATALVERRRPRLRAPRRARAAARARRSPRRANRSRAASVR